MISWMERAGAQRLPGGAARGLARKGAIATALVLVLAACDDVDAPAAIVAPTAASVAIVQEGLQLQVGDTRALAAEIRDADGEPIPDAPLAWRSGDARVADVDARGVVSALRAGGTHVYAESGLLRDSVSVSVFERADVGP